MILPTSTQIALFFKNPSDFNGKDQLHSTLYLLRRDTNICFGVNPNDGSKISSAALFPGVMAILAGIDLVAKFNYGDEDQSVSKRFKKYLTEFIDPNFAEELFQLRNSMLHSFGLYSKWKGNVYRFILLGGLRALVEKHPENIYRVDIVRLWAKFEDSIGMYRTKLMQSLELQLLFNEMFMKYGTITIG